MLKQNLLKILLKPRHVFPNRLSSLTRRFESFDGEELETFQRDGLRFDGEIDYQNEGFPEMSGCEFLEIRGFSHKDKHGKEVVATRTGIDEKRWDLDYELSQQEINLEKLQRIASSGIPEGGDLRPMIWKLLLGYLPTSRDLWEKELAENRMKYAKLKEEFLLNPSEFSKTKDEEVENNGRPAKCDTGTGGSPERQEVSNEDHPLCLGKASVWHQYFEFTEVSEQIDRDLQRTHPTLKFFSGESVPSKENKESMKNILLLFAKLNPEISYVQGMNEVLAPLYYVFSTDSDKKNLTNAEADSFYCFVNLMSDSLDHFCAQLDNSSTGVHSTLSRLSELLKANDEELWRHLQLTNKVNPQLYGFRWITLLLTQEFDFCTVLRIWDSLLSNPLGVQEMLLRVCCAMLLSAKTRLLSGDFVDNLELLQHYPETEMDVECILKTAQDITPHPSFLLPYIVAG